MHNADGTLPAARRPGRVREAERDARPPSALVEGQRGVGSAERAQSMGKVVGAILNDWRLAGVLTAGSGASLRPELQLPEQRRQREPDRLARLRRAHRLRRRSGQRLLGRPVQRSSTSTSVTGPTYNSVGLESGRNMHARLRRQPRRHVALARHPPGRQPHARVPARRVQPVQHGHLHQPRRTRSSYDSPTDLTLRNSQTLADGSIDPARLVPRNAGFGAATGAHGAAQHAAAVPVRVLISRGASPPTPTPSLAGPLRPAPSVARSLAARSADRPREPLSARVCHVNS